MIRQVLVRTSMPTARSIQTRLDNVRNPIRPNRCRQLTMIPLRRPHQKYRPPFP